MRIVFASLGSLGDLHPIMALAQAANERGHEPIIAAASAYRGYVESFDLPFSPIRPELETDPSRMEYLAHPTRGPERFLREDLFPSVRDTYTDLLAATEGADLLVVGELLYVAPMVADRLKIPWANVILAPSSFLSALDPCVLAPAPDFHALRHLGPLPHRLIFAFGRFLTSRWGAPYHAFREELGYNPGPSPIFEGKHSPHLVLACFPSFLAAPQRDWPPSVIQTGFPFFTQRAEPDTLTKLDTFLANGAPPIVFTLGSTAVHIARDFYACAVASARALDRRAIILLGKNTPPPLDENTLALPYAPLHAILPRAAAIVHHGGVGTCAEALLAGIPSLVIPFGYDQPDNGARLQKLGVARVLPKNRFSQITLTASLSQILSPEFAARSRELSSTFHPAKDLVDSIKALESLR